MDDPTLTWDAFVASLVDEYAQRGDGDRLLWRVMKPDREIVCRLRQICTVDAMSASSFASSTTAESISPNFTGNALQSSVASRNRALLEAEGWTFTE